MQSYEKTAIYPPGLIADKTTYEENYSLSAAEVGEYADYEDYHGAEGCKYPGGVRRFGYGGGGGVLGARGGGGVAVGNGVKSVISGYVVAYLLAAVGDVAAYGAYADGFGRDCGGVGGVGSVSVYRYVEGVEGEGEAAHGGVDAVGGAGGAYRGCAVGGGGVGSDNILFRFAAAQQQAMGGENQDYVEFIVHCSWFMEVMNLKCPHTLSLHRRRGRLWGRSHGVRISLRPDIAL